MLKREDYTYDLPDGLIADTPADPRDSSNLLVLNRENGEIEDKIFRDIADYLGEGDVLVLNDSKVFPARIKAKRKSGKDAEILLLRRVKDNWVAIAYPGLKPGAMVTAYDVGIKILDKRESGELLIDIDVEDEWEFIMEHGQTPLPPYIENSEGEEAVREKYQTVYSNEVGSAAAPTAGLHFTEELLAKLKDKGVQVEYVTLHVGLGTFQKLWDENIESNTLHTEFYEIKEDVFERIANARMEGKRIVAVGTTTTRTLESVFTHDNPTPGVDSTNLFINPPYEFKFVDALITNFHLPESSLLMLVSAFCTKPNTGEEIKRFSDLAIGKAYHHAIKNDYRFYSFGDAMMIK